jgi:hypothetical protein
MLKRALAVWLLIIVAESIHGTCRTLFLVPLVGDFPARQVSVFTGMVIIFTIAWFTHRWMVNPHVSRHPDESPALSPSPPPQTIFWQIGALWVALTLAFEITLGRALGLSWPRIFEDYDLRNGGLMLIGLVGMFITPWVVTRMRQNK